MSGQGALSDIHILEFGGFAAGPSISKELADYGAEVIRVESGTRPDGFRTNYPPFKDNIPGLNRGGLFALCNNNKMSITLNLRVPEALEVALRLVTEWTDVILENMTPGTIARLGLGYERLSALKPGLTMISSCNQGQTGPHASHPGFGSHLSSLAGFTNVTGFPDGPPTLTYGPYIDYIAAGYGTLAVLAALEYRQRTGRGQYIDLSQYEAGLQFMIPALLEAGASGQAIGRIGNRDRSAAPHGVFPCRGNDEWCAISVWSDQEWQRLVAAMGSPPWALDPALATFGGRKAREDELERWVSEWTVVFTPEDLADRLQEAGVHAAPVNDMADLFTDPQLVHRGQWWPVDHAEMGHHHHKAPPFLLSDTPAELRLPAPCLGEHTEHVLREIVGLSQAEIDALAAKGGLT